MNKQLRQQIFDKYNGHCAYCGCELKLDEMQVDHFKPLARNVPDRWLQEERGTNDFENLMPSCRMCNFYKGRDSIEIFRKKLNEMLDYKHTFATRLALKYGILIEQKWDGKFYFEKPEESYLKEGDIVQWIVNGVPYSTPEYYFKVHQLTRETIVLIDPFGYTHKFGIRAMTDGSIIKVIPDAHEWLFNNIKNHDTDSNDNGAKPITP